MLYYRHVTYRNELCLSLIVLGQRSDEFDYLSIEKRAQVCYLSDISVLLALCYHKEASGNPSEAKSAWRKLLRARRG